MSNLYPTQVKALSIILLLSSVLITGGCTPTHRKFETCKMKRTVPINCQNLKTKDYCVFLNGSIKWVDAGKLDFEIAFNNGPFNSDLIQSTDGVTPSEMPIKSREEPYKYTIKCKNNNVEDPMIRVP